MVCALSGSWELARLCVSKSSMVALASSGPSAGAPADPNGDSSDSGGIITGADTPVIIPGASLAGSNRQDQNEPAPRLDATRLAVMVLAVGVCILSGESSDGREAQVEEVLSAIWGTRGLADGVVSNQGYGRGHEEWDEAREITHGSAAEYEDYFLGSLPSVPDMNNTRYHGILQCSIAYIRGRPNDVIEVDGR